MTTFHKSVAATLNSKKDKDLIEFIDSEVESTGVSNSHLIKKALRFYKDSKGSVNSESAEATNVQPSISESDKIDLIRQLVKEELANSQVVEHEEEVAEPEIIPEVEVKSNIENKEQNRNRQQVDKVIFEDDLGEQITKDDIQNIIGDK